ncbi:SdpI family protein [Halolamina litorea]
MYHRFLDTLVNTSGRFGLAGAIVAASAAVGVLAAPSLPAEMATHWNAAGQPDDTLPKAAALAVLPAVSIGLLALFAALPRIDPRRENVASFRAAYDWFVVLLVGFLSVIQVGIVAYNLGYRFPFVSLVLLGAAGLLYYAGVLVGRAEQNWFVGIRTPWTLESEEVWERTHEVGAPLFKLCAASTLLAAVFTDWALLLTVAPVLLTVVITVGYSYRLSQRLEAE